MEDNGLSRRQQWKQRYFHNRSRCWNSVALRHRNNVECSSGGDCKVVERGARPSKSSSDRICKEEESVRSLIYQALQSIIVHTIEQRCYSQKILEHTQSQIHRYLGENRQFFLNIY